jgi:hypothetical protein
MAHGPPGPEDLSWQKVCLAADSMPVFTTKTTPAAVAEFRFSSDWSACLADLNSLDFSISCILQANVQAMPHSNLAILGPSIAADCDWLVTEHFHQICHSFCCRQQAAAKKNEVLTAKMVSQLPNTHQPTF